MRTVVISPINAVTRFYEAPIGKKVIIAVTGLILFGYVIGHLIGNLQIYSPDHDQINRYAAFLHSPANVIPLWVIRVLLLVAVGLHVIASIQLWRLTRAARPVEYVKKNDVSASYAARTMIWSGPIVGAFVIFHILHLTAGRVLELRDVAQNAPDVRYNVISGFQHPVVSLFYVIAMILLCMHLYHGLWSMCQSVGFSNRRYTPFLKKSAAVCAILIASGNISIPIAALAGWISY
jgi:succinate dehydrogenase / fumarate reductase cytochrome b subunit